MMGYEEIDLKFGNVSVRIYQPEVLPTPQELDVLLINIGRILCDDKVERATQRPN